MTRSSRSLRVVGAIVPEEVTRLDAATRLDTLEEILRWGGHVLDVVVQDEYNHDVVVSKAPAMAFLVFDTT